MPAISVIIPAYNHEKYVAEALLSVLDQTFQDFEIIITNNGSSDNTGNEIKKFTDPRIRLFSFTQNKGAVVAINHCLSQAKGEYLAMLNSDDIFIPDKLEKQVKYLELHSDVGVVFSRAEIVDENGNAFLKKDHFYYDVFNKENRSRHEWLNYFFYCGNCLCYPSALMRRSVYETIGQYNPSYAQLPDFDFWVRVCLKCEIYVLEEKLLKFRIRDNNMNASGDKLENHTRGEWEHSHIIRNFFNIHSLDSLLKIFPELHNQYTEFDGRVGSGFP